MNYYQDTLNRIKSAEIDSQIAEFLAGGGTITQLDTVTRPKPTAIKKAKLKKDGGPAKWLDYLKRTKAKTTGKQARQMFGVTSPTRVYQQFRQNGEPIVCERVRQGGALICVYYYNGDKS
ncbi:hypothetical protein ACFBZI_08465 [Moraxella sp. ZJ142]|uniref:hypothetical protein n=1 Tax=Moraxella marmotae TaxID=3344520 RepID=UPI0035D4A370